MMNYGLQREKIAATLDKRPLAKAIVLVVDALVSGVETHRSDFWVNVDLNVNIRGGRAFDKHARINVYIPLSTNGSRPNDGKVAIPAQESRKRIEANLDEVSLAWSLAWVIETLLTAVRAEQDDFWVNIDLDAHISQGKALEKKARINVYGDLIDSYGTTIVESVDSNEIPQEILETFCNDFEMG
jgi:hypothetical protein